METAGKVEPSRRCRLAPSHLGRRDQARSGAAFATGIGGGRGRRAQSLPAGGPRLEGGLVRCPLRLRAAEGGDGGRELLGGRRRSRQRPRWDRPLEPPPSPARPHAVVRANFLGSAAPIRRGGVNPLRAGVARARPLPRPLGPAPDQRRRVLWRGWVRSDAGCRLSYRRPSLTVSARGADGGRVLQRPSRAPRCGGASGLAVLPGLKAGGLPNLPLLLRGQTSIGTYF